MNILLFIVPLILVISLLLNKKDITEHFQETDKEKSVEDILGDLEIDLSSYVNKKGEIAFDELPLDTLDNTALDSILKKIGTSEENGDNALKLDIERANLLRREIMKRKLLRKQQVTFEELKKRNKQLEQFSRGETSDIVNKCYLQEHGYNVSGSIDRFNLEYTRHPMKWYGLETKLSNVFPANYAFV